MVKVKEFSRPLSAFQVLFKANLISRTFQDSPVYSSTLQACANPIEVIKLFFTLNSTEHETCHFNIY